MKRLLLLVAAWALVSGACLGAPPPVELIADAPILQPSSTLELRFARPMVLRDEIGLASKQSPIRIAPPLAGGFTWLSRSSGVFVPNEPWPLDTEFQVTLAKGVNVADGKVLAGSFPTVLRTPRFERVVVRRMDSGEF